MSQLVRRGLAVGLIGYASVAVFYAAFDVLAARGGLYTVDLLGKALFRGLRDPSVLGLPMQLDWTAIMWYNLVHLGIALMVGFVVVALVEDAIRNPSRSTLPIVIIVLGFVVTVAAMTLITEPIRALLPLWSIVLANVLAVAVAGWYLVKAYPNLWGKLTTSVRPDGNHHGSLEPQS